MSVSVERETPRTNQFFCGTCEKETFLRIVEHAVDFGLQAAEGVEFLSEVVVCVPDQDGAIAASACEFFAVGREGEGEDGSAVGFPLFGELVLGEVKKGDISEASTDSEQVCLWRYREAACVKADLEAFLECSVGGVVAVEVAVIGDGDQGLIVVDKANPHDFS